MTAAAVAHDHLDGLPTVRDCQRQNRRQSEAIITIGLFSLGTRGVADDVETGFANV